MSSRAAYDRPLPQRAAWRACSLGLMAPGAIRCLEDLPPNAALDSAFRKRQSVARGTVPWMIRISSGAVG